MDSGGAKAVPIGTAGPSLEDGASSLNSSFPSPAPPSSSSSSASPSSAHPPSSSLPLSTSSITTPIVPEQQHHDTDCCCCGEMSVSIGKVGTYASFVLIVLGMCASIIAQHYAEDLSNDPAWLEDCPAGYEVSCRGHQAVLRFSFALVIIFILQLLGTTIWTPFYDKFWLFKYLVFIGIVIGFFYVKGHVFDANGYAWFARIAGFFFVILQEVILIDFAYTWNEKWVAYSEDQTFGDSNRRWLVALLISSILILAGSVCCIGVMFWQFAGCSDNNVIISLTLIFSTIATLFQLFCTDQGSILTSSIMTAYATYICYAAITLNPDESCNPTISTRYQTVSEVIGMFILVLSLTWATYSLVLKIPGENVLKLSFSGTLNGNGTGESAYAGEGIRGLFQEISGVFILICCYYAMVLTNWATEQSDYTVYNPKTGKGAMWLQASAQWVALLLYIWTLVAPKIFPNREFGRS